MTAYIRRRLLYMLPTIFVPLTLVFLLLRLAPGDPAVQILGNQATPEQIAALRHTLGLDQSLPVQFLFWLKGVLMLQLGDSLFFHQPVIQILPAYAGVTLEIALVALAIAVLVGLLAGILGALHPTLSIGT